MIACRGVGAVVFHTLFISLLWQLYHRSEPSKEPARRARCRQIPQPKRLCSQTRQIVRSGGFGVWRNNLTAQFISMWYTCQARSCSPVRVNWPVVHAVHVCGRARCQALCERQELLSPIYFRTTLYGNTLTKRTGSGRAAWRGNAAAVSRVSWKAAPIAPAGECPLNGYIRL